jgi:Na+/proline symporter
VGALLSRNIIEPLKPDLSERNRLWLQRGMTAVTGGAVYFVATSGESIYDLIETTSSFGSAGIMVVMIVGLWLKWGGPWTGFATVAAGIGLTFLTRNVLGLELAFVCSIAGCCVVYAGAAFVEARLAARATVTLSSRSLDAEQ